jgi:hypothetical protein
MDDPLMEISEAVSPRRRLEAKSKAGCTSVLVRRGDLVDTVVDRPDEGQEIDIRAVHPGHPSEIPEPGLGLTGVAEDAHPDVTYVAGAERNPVDRPAFSATTRALAGSG